MVIPGHERKSIDLAKHMLLDIVDHGANRMFLHKFPYQSLTHLRKAPMFFWSVACRFEIKTPSASELALRRAI